MELFLLFIGFWYFDKLHVFFPFSLRLFIFFILIRKNSFYIQNVIFVYSILTIDTLFTFVPCM